jgi:hypothetical protein
MVDLGAPVHWFARGPIMLLRRPWSYAHSGFTHGYPNIKVDVTAET